MAFGPDRLLATAAVDGRIKVWNLQTGRVVRTLRVSPAEATPWSFSADGRFLFGTTQSGIIYAWSLASASLASGT
jgi:WD40 repeat protein